MPSFGIAVNFHYWGLNNFHRQKCFFKKIWKNIVHMTLCIKQHIFYPTKLNYMKTTFLFILFGIFLSSNAQTKFYDKEDRDIRYREVCDCCGRRVPSPCADCMPAKENMRDYYEDRCGCCGRRQPSLDREPPRSYPDKDMEKPMRGREVCHLCDCVRW